MVNLNVNIQGKFSTLIQKGCLAMAYAYRYTQDKNYPNLKDFGAADLILCLIKGWNEGYIEDNGYVAKPVKYLNMICDFKTPCRDISKVFINSLSELPDGDWVVEYVDGAKTHFVVANRNKIVFDPSYPSLTCAKGHVFSYRKLIF